MPVTLTHPDGSTSRLTPNAQLKLPPGRYRLVADDPKYWLTAKLHVARGNGAIEFDITPGDHVDIGWPLNPQLGTVAFAEGVEPPQPAEPERVASVVVGWTNPDQSPTEKAALLRRCSPSMLGRAFQGFSARTDAQKVYASFDAQGKAGIRWFVTCHPSEMGDVAEWRDNPIGIARKIHEATPATAIPHLGNETNDKHQVRWPPRTDDIATYRDCVSVMLPVAEELHRLGRREIFAPSLTTPTATLAQACIEVVRQLDVRRRFTGLAVNWYSANAAYVRAGMKVYTDARAGRYKIAVPEWGLIKDDITPANFRAIAPIVFEADYSFLWLGWASTDDGKVWHRAVELIDRDGKDTPYMAIWREGTN